MEAATRGPHRYEGVGLIAALAPHLRPPADAAQAEHYAAIPADGASGISRDKLKLLRRVLGPYFSKYDNDASGYVDVQELGRVFEDMNEPKSQAEVVKLFAAYDANGDQKLTLDEFCVGMYKRARGAGVPRAWVAATPRLPRG